MHLTKNEHLILVGVANKKSREDILEEGQLTAKGFSTCAWRVCQKFDAPNLAVALARACQEGLIRRREIPSELHVLYRFKLSELERRVLTLLARGVRPAQIAQRLTEFNKPEHVVQCVRGILIRLKIDNLREVIILARKFGFIDDKALIT